MSLLTRIFGSSGGDARTPGPGADFWYQEVGGGTAGQCVTHETALALSVAYACIRLIATTAGALPLGLYERARNGDKQPRADYPLYSVLHDQANDEQTALEFREEMVACAVSRGTAFAEIIPGGARGAVGQLVPIFAEHSRVLREVDGQGRVRYGLEIREPGVPRRVLMRDELFILRGLGRQAGCPWLGWDPITYEARAIGAALAAQHYGAQFLENDARPSLFIKWEKSFKTAEDRTRFIDGILAAFGRGGRRHGVMVGEHGMEPKTISVTPEQAQFLETRKHHDLDVCRIYAVQPHKVGVSQPDSMTYANVEQTAIAFVTDTMLPWLVRMEQSIRRDLLVDRRLYAEHNVSGLLRGDTESRYRSYAIGRRNGWLSANDVRRMENMSGIGPEGDSYDAASEQRMASTDRRGGAAASLPKPNGAYHDNGAGLLLRGEH